MISTPLMRGETSADGGRPRKADISIHSPHARGDRPSPCHPSRRTYFNPLPPCEGRLDGVVVQPHVVDISIHSPHTRGDAQPPLCNDVSDISIHSPHTRGDSQHPRWRKHAVISIHSPLTREDKNEKFVIRWLENFNPLPSHEGRRYGHSPLVQTPSFQSTPLIRGETA